MTDTRRRQPARGGTGSGASRNARGSRCSLQKPDVGVRGRGVPDGGCCRWILARVVSGREADPRLSGLVLLHTV